MLHQVEHHTSHPMTTALRSARPPGVETGRRIADIPVTDETSPMFALLRAEMCLAADDDRSWSVVGRHVRLPDWLAKPIDVAEPTIDLLERVLVGLSRR